MQGSRQIHLLLCLPGFPHAPQQELRKISSKVQSSTSQQSHSCYNIIQISIAGNQL